STQILGGERPRVAEQLAAPPGAGCPSRRDVGEAVAVERDAQALGRRLREGVAREEGGDGRGRRQQALEQAMEVEGARRPAEQQEPELEVDARLVRGDERGRPHWVARLEAELVGLPRLAVRAPLDDDLLPDERHVREEAI